MKISDDAQRFFDEMNLSRDAVQVIAKGLAQRIIEASTNPKLEGIVYDVWGLYNEGIPRCRFALEDQSGRVTFEAAFHASGSERPVERRVSCTRQELLGVLENVRLT